MWFRNFDLKFKEIVKLINIYDSENLILFRLKSINFWILIIV